MKHSKSRPFAIVALLILGGLLWAVLRIEGPSYRTLDSPPALNPLSHLSYDFMSPDPFRGGRTWITILEGTNSFRLYRYDLEARKVLGELRGAMPVYELESGTRLLCYSRSDGVTFRHRLGSLLQRISFGKIRFATAQNHVETYWLLDLQRNAAIRLGEMTQIPGAGSSFQLSPDRRLAFNKPTGASLTVEVFLFDATSGSLKTIQVNGWPIGWWSNREILFKSPAGGFFLFNLASRRDEPFLSEDELDAFLKREKILGYPREASIFPIWNGQEYDFYLTEGSSRWQASESYLFKIDRAGRSLRVIDPEFQFRWSDRFDPGPRHYLYSGRTAGQGSSAVKLRTLATGQEQVLVPDDGSRQFSLPNFYRDNVIYRRSNSLWQVDLKGSNHTRLFPPAEIRPNLRPREPR